MEPILSASATPRSAFSPDPPRLASLFAISREEASPGCPVPPAMASSP